MKNRESCSGAGWLSAGAARTMSPASGFSGAMGASGIDGSAGISGSAGRPGNKGATIASRRYLASCLKRADFRGSNSHMRFVQRIILVMFVKHSYARYGVPCWVRSDRGGNLASQLTKGKARK